MLSEYLRGSNPCPKTRVQLLGVSFALANHNQDAESNRVPGSNTEALFDILDRGYY